MDFFFIFFSYNLTLINYAHLRLGFEEEHGALEVLAVALKLTEAVGQLREAM